MGPMQRHTGPPGPGVPEQVSRELCLSVVHGSRASQTSDEHQRRDEGERGLVLALASRRGNPGHRHRGLGSGLARRVSRTSFPTPKNPGLREGSQLAEPGHVPAPWLDRQSHLRCCPGGWKLPRANPSGGWREAGKWVLSRCLAHRGSGKPRELGLYPEDDKQLKEGGARSDGRSGGNSGLSGGETNICQDTPKAFRAGPNVMWHATRPELFFHSGETEAQETPAHHLAVGKLLS